MRAVAVAGHEAGDVVQVAQVARPRAAVLRSARTIRARLAVPTVHGGHCPQLSRSKKPSTDAAIATGQARRADHQHGAGAERGATRGERLGGERRVELGRAQRRARGSAREDEPDGLGRAARGVDHLRDRHAERHLVDARTSHVAPHGDERLLGSAERLRVGDRLGDPRERLHVLHERGTAVEPDRRREGWLGPRPGAATLEGLEHRRLLAGDVAVVAAADADGEAVERSLRDRALERFGRTVERPLEEDDGLRRRQCVRGEAQALDHLVGTPGHHVAVLEGAGLALGPVRDHERPAAFDGDRLPLADGRKPAAAAAAKAGRAKPLEDGRRGRKGSGGHLVRDSRRSVDVEGSNYTGVKCVWAPARVRRDRSSPAADRYFTK